MWRPLSLELWDARNKTWEAIGPIDSTSTGKDQLTSDSPAQFVCSAYEAFASDILTGSRRSVTFTDALARRETIETIRIAAATGVRSVLPRSSWTQQPEPT
jgi:predicted dehydrogenase